MRRFVAVALAVVAGAVAVGCSGDARLPDEVQGSVVEPTVVPTTAPPSCSNAEADEPATPTYPPLDEQPAPGEMPAGSTMAEIAERGQLVVGVSGDTLLFGSRNPLTDTIEGFDISVVQEVAKAIFDVEGEELEDRIVYKVITYAQRLPALEAREVDLVAHTMTINCNRWLRIAFSSVYYQAGQKVLVKTGSGFDTIADLDAAGARVCAPEGSTNIEEIRDTEKYPGLVVVAKPDITDCLVAMQQGEADATTGDDTVLAGFAAQDPSTEVVGPTFTEEPYGLGMNAADVDLVQFVNGVLERLRADGTLDAIAQQWLVDTGALDPDDIPALPEPDYSRAVP